jgi:hypothetical protein
LHGTPKNKLVRVFLPLRAFTNTPQPFPHPRNCLKNRRQKHLQNLFFLGLQLCTELCTMKLCPTHQYQGVQHDLIKQNPNDECQCDSFPVRKLI